MNNKEIPRSIGIIMDGNRRWAKAKGLPPHEGHYAGYQKLKEVVGWSKAIGADYLTVYAFSTENWNRDVAEVGYLKNLFRAVIDKIVEDAEQNDMRLIFLGERTSLDPDMCTSLAHAEQATRDKKSFTLGIAVSYGGRSEILDAIHRVPKEKLTTISAEEFSSLLFTRDIPDPDIVIRPGGEVRLSNFLPWQSIYSELVFTKTLWPDFTREEFEHILGEYAARERRRGK